MTLELYWRLLGAKVELSSTMVNGQRVHSIVKLFKKYGTQSTLRKLKIWQEKKLGWVLETNKYRSKNGTLPSLDPGERWTEHNVDAYIPEDIKRMMNRHGKCVFLVKHLQSRHGTGAVFTSSVREASQ